MAARSSDGNAISGSGVILIFLGAKSAPRSANQLHSHSEPVQNQVTIRAPKGLKLYTRSRAAEQER